MKTDITELAHSLKAAAEGVIKNYDCEWFETGRQICTVHKSKVNLISLANPVNILALVEALEKAQTQIIALQQKAEIDPRTHEIIDLQERIAELEVSHTKLRESMAAIHNTICRDGAFTSLATILNAAKRAHEESGSAAGIKVEADSLDADVNDRNQPGMVVAVHIDAGDFVKFRGQVYEVKETDFDDHDVTLWFVCGEALKCAAGCQIEVVSAPGETE